MLQFVSGSAAEQSVQSQQVCRVTEASLTPKALVWKLLTLTFRRCERPFTKGDCVSRLTPRRERKTETKEAVTRKSTQRKDVKLISVSPKQTTDLWISAENQSEPITWKCLRLWCRLWFSYKGTGAHHRCTDGVTDAGCRHKSSCCRVRSCRREGREEFQLDSSLTTIVE